LGPFGVPLKNISLYDFKHSYYLYRNIINMNNVDRNKHPMLSVIEEAFAATKAKKPNVKASFTVVLNSRKIKKVKFTRDRECILSSNNLPEYWYNDYEITIYKYNDSVGYTLKEDGWKELQKYLTSFEVWNILYLHIARNTDSKIQKMFPVRQRSKDFIAEITEEAARFIYERWRMERINHIIDYRKNEVTYFYNHQSFEYIRERGGFDEFEIHRYFK
jgi:hypothetical protein